MEPQPLYASLDGIEAVEPPMTPRTARNVAVTDEVSRLIAAAARRREGHGGSDSELPPVAASSGAAEAASKIAEAGEENKTVIGDLRAMYAGLKQELQFRPFFATAEGAAGFSVLAAIISLAAPWQHISDGDVLGTKAEGALHLLYLHLCTLADGGRSDYLNGRACTTVDLVEIATSADYLRRGGGTTFALLFFAIPSLVAAWSVIRARRKESIDDSWLLLRFPVLRSQSAACVLCWFCSILLLSAWGSFVTTVVLGFDGVGLAKVMGKALPIGTVTGSGLVLVALAWLAMVYAAGVVTLYPDEPVTGGGWRHIRTPSFSWPPSGSVQQGGGGKGQAAAASGIFAGTDTSAEAYFGGGSPSKGGSASGVAGAGMGGDAFLGLAADPSVGLLPMGAPSTPADTALPLGTVTDL